VEEYSLADLVEITGAKPRSLQIWAERGVIHPIKSTSGAGTGVHRLFSRKEAIIACIIHPFALRQIAIGELLAISDRLRGLLNNPAAAEIIEKAVVGRGDTMLIVESWHEGRKDRHSISIGTGFLVPENREPGAFVMAIRLQTYLSKLK
jgi:hypothetical protein